MAGGVALDRADRDALVRNTAQFAPARQNSQQAAVDMGRISACMPADFFEINRFDRPGQPVDLGQPVGEAQVAHAATVVAAGLEADGAAGDQPVKAAQRPAGDGAEVQRQNCAMALRRRHGRFRGCTEIGLGESRVSHEWSPLLVGCSGGRRRRSCAWRYRPPSSDETVQWAEGFTGRGPSANRGVGALGGLHFEVPT